MATKTVPLKDARATAPSDDPHQIKKMADDAISKARYDYHKLVAVIQTVLEILRKEDSLSDNEHVIRAELLLDMASDLGFDFQEHLSRAELATDQLVERLSSMLSTRKATGANASAEA